MKAVEEDGLCTYSDLPPEQCACPKHLNHVAWFDEIVKRSVDE